MATIYTYSNSSDFPNGIISGQLFGEIELDTDVTQPLINVLDVVGDDVEISFEAGLTAGEINTLDGIVATHLPSLNQTVTSDGYVELSSTLADNRAIRITAIDAAGGIDIDAGSGGIEIDTTNSISINGEAECNFSTINGNMILESNAITSIQSSGTGSAGINIGTSPVDQTLNFGTGTGAKNINIGNSTDSTKVNINSGTGGFYIDTTNGGVISLDAIGASSNFSLTTNADGQDLTIGIIGSNDCSLILDSQGTSGDAIRLNSAGGIDVDASGSINFNTGSTAADAFRFSNSGTAGFVINLGSAGLDLDTTGPINLATSHSSGGAITLDSSTAGGITISSGSFGILMQVAFGGAMNLGNDVNTGNVGVGNGARARTVTVGSTTTTSNTVVQSGTGGLSLTSVGTGDITINSDDTLLLDADGVLEINSSAGAISIGNDADAQNINIGTGTAARTITIGNTTGATQFRVEYGTGGRVYFNASAPTSLSDAAVTLTVAQILTEILHMDPSTDRTVTMPTAANLVSGIANAKVGDRVEFVMINESTGNDVITLAMGTGGTLIGSALINPQSLQAHIDPGTGRYVVRLTNVTASSEAYTVYRV